MPEVQFSSSCKSVAIPDGYGSIESGDHYLTRTVKRLCNERNVTCYVEVRTYKRKFCMAVRYFAPLAVIALAKRLGEESALLRSEQRKKATAFRQKREAKYAKAFADRIKELFPGIPEGDPDRIAYHTCEVGSERVGRTRQIELDKKVELAVIAHARHEYTDYDEWLAEVWSKSDYQSLRSEIAGVVEQIVDGWRAPNRQEEKIVTSNVPNCEV